VLIVMGISGSGASTIGSLPVQRLQWDLRTPICFTRLPMSKDEQRKSTHRRGSPALVARRSGIPVIMNKAFLRVCEDLGLNGIHDRACEVVAQRVMALTDGQRDPEAIREPCSPRSMPKRVGSWNFLSLDGFASLNDLFFGNVEPSLLHRTSGPV
jgi:hypothetical protein